MSGKNGWARAELDLGAHSTFLWVLEAGVILVHDAKLGQEVEAHPHPLTF